MARWVKAKQLIRMYKTSITPVLNDGPSVGDLWVDTGVSPITLKKCTSISPVTWVTTEGGVVGGTAAPVDAAYLVTSSNATLTAESVIGTDFFVSNSHIDASAAIARSKIAAGTASHVLVNDGSGNLSSEALLAISRGGTNASTAAVARTNLGINVNSARSYSLVVLAFNTGRTPSTTQDTLVIATVEMDFDDGEDSTITFQIDDGGGYDSIYSLGGMFNPSGIGVSGTAVSRQTMTVIVPANSIYKIISAGTGNNTIETINELTL